MSDVKIPEDLRTDYAELKQEAHELSCDERDSSYPRWIMRLIERIAALEAERDSAFHMRDLAERNCADHAENLVRVEAEREALKEKVDGIRGAYDCTSQELHDRGLKCLDAERTAQDWRNRYFNLERAHGATVDKLSDAIQRIQLRERELAERGAQKSAFEQENAALRAQVKRRDGEWIASAGKFRQALHEAGLHGHYNLFQQWEWPVALTAARASQKEEEGATPAARILGQRKAKEPCSDCVDGWCTMNCGPRVKK